MVEEFEVSHLKFAQQEFGQLSKVEKLLRPKYG